MQCWSADISSGLPWGVETSRSSTGVAAVTKEIREEGARPKLKKGMYNKLPWQYLYLHLYATPLRCEN